MNGNITRQFGLRYEGILSLFEFLGGNLDDFGPSSPRISCLRSSAYSFTRLLMNLNSNFVKVKWELHHLLKNSLPEFPFSFFLSKHTYLYIFLFNIGIFYLPKNHLDPVREECPGAVWAGDQLLHVRLPDGAEAVAQTLLLWNRKVSIEEKINILMNGGTECEHTDCVLWEQDLT